MAINLGNIDSKFRFIIVAAKRTRQLQTGSRPMIVGHSRKFTRIAMEEVASGLVKYDIIEEAKVTKRGAPKKGKGH